jgi:hypothetical protein
MERTSSEVFARAARARLDARRTSAEARVARAAVREARAQREIGVPVGSRPPGPAAGDVEHDLPLEAAAERALLRELTARELADRLRVPVGAVLEVAHERADQLGQTVDDTLRTWFRVLLACTER